LAASGCRHLTHRRERSRAIVAEELGDSPAAPANGRINVVALMENLSWGWGGGDAFDFSCFMSRDNARRLSSEAQPEKTLHIKEIGWWLVNFDHDKEKWFEEHYPLAPITPRGQLRAGSRILVADEGTAAIQGIEHCYSVFFQIDPAAGEKATFRVASSCDDPDPLALPWGQLVGGGLGA
jgi:hypothetical protein